MIELILVGFRR